MGRMFQSEPDPMPWLDDLIAEAERRPFKPYACYSPEGNILTVYLSDRGCGVHRRLSDSVDAEVDRETGEVLSVVVWGIRELVEDGS